MLRHGVTATLHANYSYATGDYEAELRGVLRAYDETGLRATVCVGYADQGGLVYPPADEARFRAALSPGAQVLGLRNHGQPPSCRMTSATLISSFPPCPNAGQCLQTASS